MLLAPQAVPWAGPLVLAEIAARSGFTALGVKLIGSAAMPASAEIVAPGFVPRMRDALRGGGVEAHSATIFYLTEVMEWDAITRSLDIAAELGVVALQVIGNDPDERRMAATLARLAELAAARGVTCLLENAPYRALGTVAAIDRLVTAAGCSAGLCLNIVNFFVTGGDALALSAINRGRLRQVQIADADLSTAALASPSIRLPRLAPGAGNLDLATVAQWLPADVLVSPEFDSPATRGDLAAAIADARASRSSLDALLSAGRGPAPASPTAPLGSIGSSPCK